MSASSLISMVTTRSRASEAITEAFCTLSQGQESGGKLTNVHLGHNYPKENRACVCKRLESGWDATSSESAAHKADRSESHD